MSSLSSKQSKATALARVQALIAGTQKHLPGVQFTLGGTSYTAASLVQDLTDLANAFPLVDAAHASLSASVAALRAMENNKAPLLRDLRGFLRATYSNAPATLADFGLVPPKGPTPLTGEKRVAATAKLRATRTARGTTSKKQKLAIKGDVTGVTVTPITSPSPEAKPAVTPAVTATTATAPAAASK